MRNAPGAFNCPPVNLDISQTPLTIIAVNGVRPFVQICFMENASFTTYKL